MRGCNISIAYVRATLTPYGTPVLNLMVGYEKNLEKITGCMKSRLHARRIHRAITYSFVI